MRRVAAGQSLLDPALTERVLERLRQAHRRRTNASPASPARSAGSWLLIADGLTNRQIAAEMHLAEKTVKNYVSNLLAKLGMERRTQAAVFAARLDDPSKHGPS